MDTSTHQLPEQAAIVVEYPGYVRNVAKAVQTLGSEETLQNCIEENSSFLKLRQRPNDPYCHPIFGDRQATAGVLLRISRKLGDEDAPVKVQVAARVERTYQFNTLSDYQYLPVNDAKVRPRAATAAPTAPATEAPEQQEPFQDMQPLLLVPPLFTRVDVALDYAYKQVKGKPAGGGAAHSSDDFSVSFYALSTPPAPAFELKEGDTSLEALLAATFQGRPITSRYMLGLALQAANPSHTDLEPLIRKHCYCFRTGPFRTLLVRRGYDPRTDKGSRPYQAARFQVPGEWYEKVVGPALAALELQRRQGQARQQAGATEQGAAGGQQAMDVEQDAAQQQEAAGGGAAALPPISHSIETLNLLEGLPAAKTVILQVCDIREELVQAHSRDLALTSKCTETNGWFSYAGATTISGIINARMKELASAPGTKMVLLPPLEVAAAPGASWKDLDAAAAAPQALPAPAVGQQGASSQQGEQQAAAGGGEAAGADAGAAAGAGEEVDELAAAAERILQEAAGGVDGGAELVPPQFLASLMEQLSTNPDGAAGAWGEGDEDFEIYGEEGGEESPGGLSEGATTSGGETDATSATSDAGMSGEEDEEGDLGF